MAIVLDGTSGITTPALDSAGTITAPDVDSSLNGLPYPDASSIGFRNRIINGDMRIDQRNAGAAVANSAGYVVDRWSDIKAGGGAYTAQQSTTAPSGFTNSFQHTVTTAVTPSASDVYQIFQPIEGYNTADLGFGTASAQAVTVSFWVRSSITGLYAVSLRNSAGNRSYVATYSIAAANTWEQKTVTIPGDTSGTWLTNNSAGIILIFDLGSGSNQNTTAGAWQAGDFRRTSGCVNWISTSGAAFYITGVQLEAGSTATPFERRDYGRELIMCQRYFQVSGTTGRLYGYSYLSTAINVFYNAPVQFRANPSITLSTTSMGIENVPWIAATTGSGCAANAGHVSISTFDFIIDGFSGLSSSNQPVTVTSAIFFSAEL